jgi:thiol-disulfide isomerase/thioredoxin
VRRAVLAAAVAALVLVPFLAACGPGSPAQAPQARSRLDVASPDLVAYKSRTGVPDCPKVAPVGVSGGMPAVTLPCLGGGRDVDVAGLRGPMIVNFWQAFCGPCREEMPALADFARSQDTVKVLGVDYLDTQPGPALQLARDSDVGYPLVADPAGNLDHADPLPHITGLPFTAFIDADGKVVHVEAGAMETLADVRAKAHQYLGADG